MGRYGVQFQGRWVDVTVSRPKDGRTMIPVWLTWVDHNRARRRELLCQLAKQKFGWTVVVAGNNLTGLRMVDGFTSQWKAWEYAVEVRSDINTEFKKMRERERL